MENLLNQWIYRVLTPDGKVITIEEYMKTKDYLDRVGMLEEIEEEPQPVYVGTLTIPFGLNGYSKAETGHEVFELKDKYLITIFNNKNEPHIVSFYKSTLEPYIKKHKE